MKRWYMCFRINEEDKKIILEVAQMQKRSMASFVLDTALSKARQVLKEENGTRNNFT